MSDARRREAEPPPTRCGGQTRYPAAVEEPRRRNRTKSCGGAPRSMKMRTVRSPWLYGQMRLTARAQPKVRQNSRDCCTLSTSPEAPCGLGFASDPCLPACNALHCHALQLEKSHGGSGRKDEDDAAAAARTGAARVASRRCRPALAGGATAGGEAGRRPRPGSRARRVEMDRIGLRV